MPRSKVIDRKRVVKACTNCKRRKEKCDGIQPCGRCKQRSRETECDFPDDITSTNTRNASTSAIHSHEDSLERDRSSVSNQPRHDISRRNVLNGDISLSNAATSAPVQELPVRTPPKHIFSSFARSANGFISSTLETSGLVPLLGFSKRKHTPEPRPQS